jgi:urease accessory protein
MRAHALLEAALVPESGRTRLTRLRSEPPLVLRLVNPAGREPLLRWNLGGRGAARVSLVAAAAGPIGGDRLRLDVVVGPGAVLVLRTVAASLVLPGPHGEPSSTGLGVHVAAGATLVWLPEPVIAAARCNHRSTTRISLERDARLLAREELILGRHGEAPGTISQRLRVMLDGRPLHDQELRIGPETGGWEGAAVTGGRRALGSLLVVDPALDAADPAAVADADSALLPLRGAAVLLTALGSDSGAVRRRLDEGLKSLERPAVTV